MNPSSSTYTWNNPPPPGTEFDSPEEDSNFSSHKNDSTRSSDRAINRIDPYVKNPVYQAREEDISSERIRYRSRSKSSERPRRRRRSRSYSRSRSQSRRRSKSRSRDRYRRSRSKSRRRRRRFSSSYSRSRSRSASSRHRRRKHVRRYSRSRSRSRSKTRTYRSSSRSYSRSRSFKGDRERKRSRSPRIKEEARESDSEKYIDGDVIGEEDMKIEEPEPEQEAEYDQGPIPFKNDGSFLEMFKKMQEMQKVKEEPPEEPIQKKPLLPVFGKRRGGKVLKTGIVAKVRNVEDDSSNAQDAWSVYMKEVRRYKEVHCDDDSKTRPLVK